MVYLLVEVYQVIRTPLPFCSLIRPGNRAKDSISMPSCGENKTGSGNPTQADDGPSDDKSGDIRKRVENDYPKFEFRIFGTV